MIPGRPRLAATALVLIGCALTGAPGAGQAPARPTRLSVVTALDLYQARPGAEVPRRLAQQDFINSLNEYRAEAGDWIQRARQDERPFKQRVAAALAVELFAVALDGELDEYRAAKPLVEWFCDQLKKQPPSEFERMAMIASLAALQGAGDSYFFGIEAGPYTRKGHIDHAVERFPGDDRLRLARVLERHELRLISTVPLQVREVLPNFSHHRTPEEASKRLKETLDLLTALEGPLVRDEARMRRGVLQFITGRSTMAMTDLGASAVADAPFASYIANLMLGSVYYTTGDSSAAAARYSKAMHIVPATSARLGLAAALMRLGNNEEAAAIAVPRPPSERVEDPWRLYSLGLFHELPGYLDAMRNALR